MEIFLSAFTGALLSTLPIGPINLVLMQFAVLRLWERWLACVLGVLIVDGFYCLLSLRFYGLLEAWIKDYASVSSLLLAAMLAVFGFSMFFHGRARIKQTVQRSVFGFFLFGLFATLVEPALGLFWLSWWSAAHWEAPNVFMATSGLLCGDMLVFGAYAILAKLFPKPDFAMQRKLGQALGLVLIFAAIFLFLQWQSGGRSWVKV